MNFQWNRTANVLVPLKFYIKYQRFEKLVELFKAKFLIIFSGFLFYAIKNCQ